MLSGFPPIYQNKLQEQGVQDVVNINKIKFEPHGDFVDRAYLRFSETLINNQDPNSQIENDETPEVEYLKKMIQKTQKQTKRLQFPPLCHKCYKMVKLQKV